ncbi:hypothetical protein Mal64_08410 [Pseudobythopirellula maris]|uniref:Hypervirulence associated protein TUDOR domain-containing protein n=1 Tax=Pseudobythopirellula maris TaxID=2527991 RepID=A0A5C5ZSC6_9BACT|nr:DUF2945 domain-containing protein [Pseudobythopirellula maris]TWT90452.1 hypothetical protein Mal64_08410 [Pseudobythopirellula maris]
MASVFEEGQRVKWKWGEGYGQGRVKSRFTKRVTRKIEGNEVTRDGSQDNPAYYVETEDGGKVLKLWSELESA